MNPFVCVTCGAYYPEAPAPPAACLICEDERQYVGHDGQRWTTLRALQRDHRNAVVPLAPGLTGFATEPKVAIGQQAHLVQTPAGNLLWNCTNLVDAATLEAVGRLGGLAAVAVSHPHFFTGGAAWSQAFGRVPVVLHADDRAWITHPDPSIWLWDGDSCDSLPDGGLTLVRCGGHFPGSCVLHWPAGADGRGVLLTGDTMTVVSDRRWVSFMYSYPNLIPLGADAVRRIVAAVEPFAFDRIYRGWYGSVVAADAKAAVRRSAERYLNRTAAG